MHNWFGKKPVEAWEDDVNEIDEESATELKEGLEEYVEEVNTDIDAAGGNPDDVPNWKQKITDRNKKLQQKTDAIFKSNEAKINKRFESLPTEAEREEATKKLIKRRGQGPLLSFLDLLEHALQKVLDVFYGFIRDAWQAIHKAIEAKITEWHRNALAGVLSHDPRFGTMTIFQDLAKVFRQLKNH